MEFYAIGLLPLAIVVGIIAGIVALAFGSRLSASNFRLPPFGSRLSAWLSFWLSF